MGKIACWKLHKPMKRIMGDDVISLKRPCLFCPKPIKSMSLYGAVVGSDDVIRMEG